MRRHFHISLLRKLTSRIRWLFIWSNIWTRARPPSLSLSLHLFFYFLSTPSLYLFIYISHSFPFQSSLFLPEDYMVCLSMIGNTIIYLYYVEIKHQMWFSWVSQVMSYLTDNCFAHNCLQIMLILNKSDNFWLPCLPIPDYVPACLLVGMQIEKPRIINRMSGIKTDWYRRYYHWCLIFPPVVIEFD